MMKITNSEALKVGDWLVEPSLLRISRGRDAEVLEPRLMDLLVYLAQHAGETVSIDELADSVWEGRAVSDQPIYQSMAQLRKALEDDAHHPRYIVTVSKKGYRLIAPVEIVGQPSPAVETSGKARPRRRPMPPALALMLAGSYLFLSTSDVSVSLESAGPANAPYGSIAVLPFTDMSEDHDFQYFGDGLAGELINQFATHPGMQVVARTSSFTFRDSATTVQDIGRALGADLVLEGSVRRDGATVRVTATLIRTDTGYRIWSQSYEPLAERAFMVKNQIVHEIASNFWPGEVPQYAGALRFTNNSEAAEAYYLGQFHMHRRRADSLDRAIDYYEKAVEFDPEFANAFAALAFAYFLASEDRYGDLPRDEAEQEYEIALHKAQVLNDRLPRVLLLLAGDAMDAGRLEESETMILKAIEVNPNFASAYQTYGFLLRMMGRNRKVLEANMTAARIDPLGPVHRVNLADSYHDLAMLPEAEVEYLRAIELDPDWHLPYAFLAGLHAEGGRLASAISLGQQAYRLEGPDARFAGRAAMEVGYSLFTLGDYEQAETWFARGTEAGVDGWFVANHHIQLMLAQDKYDAAAELLTSWQAREPESPNVFVLGGLYRAMMNQPDAAIAMLEHALSLQATPDDDFLYTQDFINWGYLPALHLSRLYALSGQDELAVSLLDDSEDRIRHMIDDGIGTSGVIYLLASIAAERGNRQEAMLALQRAIGAGWSEAWFLERDPVFSDFREDDEFAALLDGLKERLATERAKADENDSGTHTSGF